MRATRKTQPYKRGAASRTQTRALSAAVKGATAGGINPMDARRQAQKAQRGQAVAASGAAEASARARAAASPGSLRGAVQQKVAAAVPKESDAYARSRRRTPGKAKLPGEKKGAGQRVRAPKGAKRTLRDGLSPRLYATGTKTNTSGNEREGEEYRTFTKGGREFHEYVDKKTGKKVVVAGGKKSAPRKLS